MCAQGNARPVGQYNPQVYSDLSCWSGSSAVDSWTLTRGSLGKNPLDIALKFGQFFSLQAASVWSSAQIRTQLLVVVEIREGVACMQKLQFV